MLKVTFNEASMHANSHTQCGVVAQEGEADLKLNTKCAFCFYALPVAQ